MRIFYLLTFLLMAHVSLSQKLPEVSIGVYGGYNGVGGPLYKSSYLDNPGIRYVFGGVYTDIQANRLLSIQGRTGFHQYGFWVQDRNTAGRQHLAYLVSDATAHYTKGGVGIYAGLGLLFLTKAALHAEKRAPTSNTQSYRRLRCTMSIGIDCKVLPRLTVFSQLQGAFGSLNKPSLNLVGYPYSDGIPLLTIELGVRVPLMIIPYAAIYPKTKQKL